MVLTPEIAGMVASIVGVLGLVLRKARCFIRRVNNSLDAGIGFCDGRITPEISREVNQACVSYRHRSASSYASEFLQKGTEVAVAIKSGVQLAESVLPYLRPLILAAAVWQECRA